jgi:dipeptidyl aminopeptidase/acylaminoacyl peptidase
MSFVNNLAAGCKLRQIFRNVLFLASAVLLLTHLLPAQDSKASKIPDDDSRALEFVKQIGVGWQTDKFGWMSFVSFSPDGTMVASDGPTVPEDVSENLTLWSFPEGRLIKRLPVRPTTISSDWKYYASYNAIGDMESGKPLISLGDGVYAIHAFSPDSHYVAESLSGKAIDDPHIRIIELANGKQLSAFGKHTAFSLAISPDGMTLASGHWNIVTLWNMFTGKRLATLRGAGRYVESLSFSRDGTFLAAGTDFGGLQIWDVGRRTRIQSLDIEGGQVSEPRFSPDGQLVAVGIYGTGTVWLIDVGTGKILDHHKVSDIGCGSVAFSPDGHFLITPSTGGLIKWPYDHGGTIRVFKINAQIIGN